MVVSLLTTQKAQVLVGMLPGCCCNVQACVARRGECCSHIAHNHTQHSHHKANTLPPANAGCIRATCMFLCGHGRLHQQASTTNKNPVNRQANHTSSSAEASTLPMHACMVYQHTLSCCRCAHKHDSLNPSTELQRNPLWCNAAPTSDCSHTLGPSPMSQSSSTLSLRLCP